LNKAFFKDNVSNLINPAHTLMLYTGGVYAIDNVCILFYWEVCIIVTSLSSNVCLYAVQKISW